MKSKNLAKNILLGFLFFFIGRFIVFQMGTIGVWVIIGLVTLFYVSWYFWRKK